MDAGPASQIPPDGGKSFFGHPRGLSTLFFTEFWERFSYYGMRAFLIFFMCAAVNEGGLGYDKEKASAIYGIYTALVYMMSVPGGWLADRFLGHRRAVFLGGVVIMFGHISLAVHGLAFFYAGLGMVILGTGLLKPNVSTMVGELYTENDPRRDAGFSVYYMGINLGAFLAPLVCGTLARHEAFRGCLARLGIDPTMSWHFGFGAAAVGMFLGLVQFVAGGRHLGTAGMYPATPNSEKEAQNHRRMLAAGLVLAAAVAVGLVVIHQVRGIAVDEAEHAIGWFLAALTLIVFGWIFLSGTLCSVEMQRMVVVAVFFVASVLFWAAFEQAGSSLNLFANERLEPVSVSIAGQTLSADATWYQSINALFIIVFAPVFGWLWIRLGKYDPSSPTKFAGGLVLVGMGFLVLVRAAQLSGPDAARVSPWWMVVAYLLHTYGELCLSPVGLSQMTKLAPQRMAGLVMGLWFLSLSLGQFIAGQVAGQFEKMPLDQLFGAIFLATAGAGIVLFVFARMIRKLMCGVH